eukprot:m51a1_g9886 hypothetical protein (3388) ;mRNA; f:25606-36846
MLEGLVASLLSRLLGDVINVEALKDLRVSLLGGSVSLQQVELKQDCLAALDLPLSVKSGVIGKLEVTVPWQRLQSQPAVVRMEHSDAAYEEEQAQRRKMKRLELEELLMRARDAGAEAGAAAAAAAERTTLRQRVVDNVQVYVRDLALRYEDDGATMPGCPFAAGLTLDELCAESADADWRSAFVAAAALVRKRVALRQLCLYWNAAGTSPAGDQRVVGPLTGEARVALSRGEAATAGLPMAEVRVALEDVSLALGAPQYRQLHALLDTWTDYTLGRPYRTFRPGAAPAQAPLLWWRFAARAALEGVRSRRSRGRWAAVRRFCEARRQYTALRRKVLAEMRLKPDEQAALDSLERELCYEDLFFLRLLALYASEYDKELIASVEQQIKERAAQQSWFSLSYYTGGGSAAAAPATAAAGDGAAASAAGTAPARLESPKDTGTLAELTPEQWRAVGARVAEHLSEQVKYDAQDQSIVWAKGALDVKTASALLYGERREEEIAYLAVERLGVAVRTYTKTDAATVQLSLGTMHLYDRCTRRSNFPILLSPSAAAPDAPEASEAPNNFLELRFEVHPPERDVDYFVGVDVGPSNIVYNPRAYDTIVSFLDAEEVAGAGWAKVYELTESVRSVLMHTLQSKSHLGIDVRLRSPSIIFPDSWTRDDSAIAIVDLGHVALTKVCAAEEPPSEEVFYSQFLVSLDKARVLLSFYEDNWAMPSEEDLQRIRVVDEFSVRVVLSLRRIPTLDIPKYKLQGNLPDLNLHISPTKYKQLMSVYDAWTLQVGDKHPAALPAAMASPTSGSFSEPPALPTKSGKMIDLLFNLQRLRVNLDTSRGKFLQAVYDGGSATFVSCDDHSFLEASVRDHYVVDCACAGAAEPPYLIRSIRESDECRPILFTAEVDKDAAGESFKTLTWKFDEAHVNFDRDALVELMVWFNEAFAPLRRDDAPSEATGDVATAADDDDTTTADATETDEGYVSADDGPSDCVVTPCASFSDDSSLWESPRTHQAAVAAAVAAQEKKPQEPEGRAEEGRPAQRAHMRIVTHMSKLRLSLSRDWAPFASFSLSRALIDMLKYPDSYTLTGTFGSMDADNHTASGVLYPRIVESGGSDAAPQSDLLSFTYTDGDHPYLSCVTKSFKIVYLAHLVDDVWHYLREMRSQLASAATRTIAYADQTVESISNNSSNMRYRVEMENPHIVAPHSSSSSNVIVFDLGHIVISNSFAMGPPNLLDTETVLTKITAMNAFSSEWEGVLSQCLAKGRDTAKLLEEMDLEVVMSYVLGKADCDSLPEDTAAAVMEQYHKTPLKSTVVTGSRFRLTLNERQYLTILGFYEENLTERASERDARVSEPAAPDPITDRDPDDVWTSFAVSLTSFSIVLGSGTEMCRSVGPAEAVVGWSMSTPCVSALNRHDESMSFDVSCEELHVDDLRACSANCFKNLLAQGSHGTRLLYTSMATEQRQTLDVEIEQPRVFWIPEPMHAVQAYLWLRWEELRAMLSRRRVRESRAGAPSARTTPPPQPQRTTSSGTLRGGVDSYFRYTARLAGASVCVVERPEDPNSRGFVVNAALHVEHTSVPSGRQQNYVLRSKGTQLYTCMAASRIDRGVSIVEPFDAVFDYTQSHLSTTVGIEFKPVSVVLSYRDLRLLLAMTEALGAAAAADADDAGAEEPAGSGAADDQEQPQPVAVRHSAALCIEDIGGAGAAAAASAAGAPSSRPVSLSPSALSSSSTPPPHSLQMISVPDPYDDPCGSEQYFGERERDARSSEASSEVASHCAPSVASSSASRASAAPASQVLSMICGPITVTLIDDCSEEDVTPLLSFVASDMSADLSGWSAKPYLSVMASLAANYYNRFNGAWEPLLEQWSVQLQARRNGKSRAVRGSVVSKERAEFNLTRGFIDTCYLTYQLWLDDMSGSAVGGGRAQVPEQAEGEEQGAAGAQAVLRTIAHPYYIRNDTGAPMWYWLPQGAVRPLVDGTEELLQVTRMDARKAADTSATEDPTTICGTTWEPDSATSCCRKCRRQFSMLCRRHHCRRCGKLFCDDCTRYRSVVDGALGRLCYACYTRLQAGGKDVRARQRSDAEGEQEEAEQPESEREQQQQRGQQLMKTGSQHVISMQIFGDVRPVYDIPFDRVGAYVVHVNKDNDAAKVVCEISHRRGGFLLSVRSNVLVENASHHPLTVILSDPANCDSHVLPVIEPGATAPVPVHFAAAAEIRFRPSDAFEWSRSCFSCRDLKRLSKRGRTGVANVVCPRSDGAPAFLYVCRVARYRNDKGSNVLEYRVTLHPPLVIENVLPRELSWQLLDVGPDPPQRLLDGTIASGGSEDVHSLHVDKAIAVAFKIADFSWSRPVMLRPPAYTSEKATEFVELLDGIQQPLFLTFECRLLETGVCKATVLGAVWLVNAMKMPMFFRIRSSLDPTSGSATPLAAGHHVFDSTGQVHAIPCLDETPFLFAIPPYGMIGRELEIQVGTSAWSRPLSLNKYQSLEFLELQDSGTSPSYTPTPGGDDDDGAGASGSESKRLFGLSMSVCPGPGPFWRTKVVRFSPLHVIVNGCASTSVAVTQRGHLQRADVVELPPHQSAAWHWPDNSKPKLLCIALVDAAAGPGSSPGSPGSPGAAYTSWSCGFPISKVGSTPLKIRRRSGPPVFVDVHVQMGGEGRGDATSVTVTTPSARFPPFRIDNETSTRFAVHQKGSVLMDSVAPGQKLPWCWDELSLPRRVVLRPQRKDLSVAVDYPVDSLARYPPLVVAGVALFRVEVVADGPTRVVRLLDVGDDSRDDDDDVAAAADEAQRSREEEAAAAMELQGEAAAAATTTFDIDVYIEGVGISVIESRPQELVYVSVDGIEMHAERTADDDKLEVVVQSMQVDNQLYNTVYPVALVMRETCEPPFVHLSVVKAHYEGIDYYKYFGVKVNEFSVYLEEELLVRLVNFFYSSPSSADAAGGKAQQQQQQQTPGAATPSRVSVVPGEQQEGEGGGSSSERPPARMVYFEMLHINPIRALFSYQSITGSTAKFEDAEISSVLSFTSGVLQAEYATVRINCLMLKSAFAPRHEMMSRVARHYRLQVMSQVYRILGSFDMIGSPLSLVETLGTGVFDFFHEPVAGIVKSPQAFGKGLAVGTLSLINNTVFGIFNTTARLSGAVSQAVAAVTFDDEYVRSRQLEHMRERPKHAGHGLLMGTRSLVEGIWRGVFGLVEQPARGAMHEGLDGLIKGVGRGVIGAVVKPAVGMLDFVTRTTEGVRNVTTVADARYCQAGSRRRLPRHVPPAAGGAVEPYSRDKAEGCAILSSVCGGKYLEEGSYLWHVQLGERLVLLASTQRLLLLERGQFDHRKVWGVHVSNIGSVQVTSRDVVIIHVTEYIDMEGDGTRRIECPTHSTCRIVQQRLFELSQTVRLQNLALTTQ